MLGRTLRALRLCIVLFAGTLALADSTFRRGDSNGDGLVDVDDAIYDLNSQFLGGPTLCADAQDANDDGEADVSDPLYVLLYLFGSGEPPPPPFLNCGADPTPDSLDCRGPLGSCPGADLVITSSPVAVANVESEYRYAVKATDPLMEPLSFSLPMAPTGAAVDSASGLITWTPTLDQVGPQNFTVRAESARGDSAEQSFVVSVREWPGPPTIDPVPSPTRALTVRVSGTAPAAVEVEISGGALAKTVPVAGSSYSADIDLVLNRVNHLFVRGINAAGQASAPAVVDVIQDREAPSVFIDFPAPRTEVLSASVIVAGRVSDMFSGFMGVSVTVNGVATIVEPGIGTNGTYETVSPVPLSIGSNTLAAVATDAVGNQTTVETTVRRLAIDPRVPQLQIVSGNDQKAPIHTDLPADIAIQLSDPGGSPFANKLVTFRITRSDGRLRAVGADPSEGALRYQTFTDAEGRARCRWQLGTDAGCANNRVEVTSNGMQGKVFFCASAQEGLPVQINVGSGSRQRGEVGTPACEPLRAWVSDACNGVADVPVTFTVVRGSGKVNGEESVTVSSTLTGHAEVSFDFGSEPGNNVVEATTEMNTGNPAVFVLFGSVRDETRFTTLSGLVLTNAGEPVERALCVLRCPTAPEITTFTRADGAFRFDDLPFTGPTELLVYGMTSSSIGGEVVPPDSLPFLRFEPLLVPNADNALPQPVLLPPLNASNTREYSTASDTVLTVEGIAGLRMTIKGGSMRFPSGEPAPDGTHVSLNIVHHDDVPMPMPDGAAPPFAWTLQPAGAVFDPPVTVEYPNMSGLPPGAVGNFLTFNHDTGKFEIFATGSVTADGSTIVTDPGDGLSLAGWGCECPPYSVTGDCERCGTDCVDSGALVGGEVTVNTRAPEYGEVLAFRASGVADTGGTKETVCTSGKVTRTSVPPRTVAYRWTITTPRGTTTSGTGPEAFIEAEDCGTFSCTFWASVKRSCAPAEVGVGSASATVKGEVGDLMDEGEIPLPLEALEAAIGIAGRALPCSVTAPDLSGKTIKVQSFEQCCPGAMGPEVKRLKRWVAKDSGSLGSASCGGPVFGVPYVLSFDVEGGFAGDYSYDADVQQECDDESERFCVTIGSIIQPFLRAAVTFGPDIIGVTGGIRATVSIGAIYCSDSLTGLSWNACIDSIDFVGTVIFLGEPIKSLTVNIFSGHQCIP